MESMNVYGKAKVASTTSTGLCNHGSVPHRSLLVWVHRISWYTVVSIFNGVYITGFSVQTPEGYQKDAGNSSMLLHS